MTGPDEMAQQATTWLREMVTTTATDDLVEVGPVQVSPEHYERLVRAAEAAGVTVSEILRVILVAFFGENPNAHL